MFLDRNLWPGKVSAIVNWCIVNFMRSYRFNKCFYELPKLGEVRDGSEGKEMQYRYLYTMCELKRICFNCSHFAFSLCCFFS